MGLPVRRVLVGQGLVADHDQVLGVGVLGLLREVETARDDRLAVDDHDLVVGDGVLGVDPHVLMSKPMPPPHDCGAVDSNI
jgi:hypothetical protein